MMNDVDSVSIVFADDDEDDCFLFRRALTAVEIKNEINFMRDGMELIEFLNRNLKNSKGSSNPYLIVLDLNMPRLDGREALAMIKNDPVLKKIPVVILTTSNNPEDVAKTYDLGASSFFTKPKDYPEFVRLFKALKEYWLQLAVFPD